jgi:hypothetical protein
MPNDTNATAAPIETRPAVHHSTFAEGECEPEAHPEEARVGAFAEVQETPDPSREPGE